MPSHQRIALHHWHAEHGARFADSDGWQVPAVYSTVEREMKASREGVALADISAFAKFSLLGKGVPELALALGGDSPASEPRGVATLAAGDLALACRLTDDHLFLLASTTSPAVLDERLAYLPADSSVVRWDATSAHAGFCLVGPRGDEVLRGLTALDITPSQLPPGSCAETGLAGVHALLVRPAGQAPPSVRVYVSWDLAEYVWERLLAAGRRRGIIPLGLEALRALGLAAC